MGLEMIGSYREMILNQEVGINGLVCTILDACLRNVWRTLNGYD